MIKINLNGQWMMTGGGYDCEGTVPGSVCSFLLSNNLMEDPYFRQNELDAMKIMENEFTFSRTFNYTFVGSRVLLHCDGLDTLCDIYLNGAHVSYTDNMHRIYEFDVTDYLRDGQNHISLTFHPVDPYIKARNREFHFPEPTDCMEGFAHIRKAHCMMGWDWGPRLPDAGIWRNIYLMVLNSSRITDFHIVQHHENGSVFVTPNVETSNGGDVRITIKAPNGSMWELMKNERNEIISPQLWWPNGLGEQSLYTVTADLCENGVVVDSQKKRIGLRSLKLIREKDVYGESFCHEVNGIRFFAMGADYIPEDCILSRVTEDRTRWLLKQCVDCNFNAIRVWGGGQYPADFFFDLCDEMGLIVFQDLMAACTMIRFGAEERCSFEQEIRDNLRRIRHHASLAIISGNNEVEEFLWRKKDADHIKEIREWYLDFFEGMAKDLVAELCPYIPYISSSPSTCGHFIEPINENYGDCHYWQVWHGNEPFTEYRNRFFRYLSEFGFQSFPCEKTVNAFTIEEDRNIFSRVMEMHQRNGAANGKILNYLSRTFLYPNNFGALLYASQLLQAEAIRYGVEHFRRHRGRCMGTLYWQLNDIWPVASWASIDYYGRYKALQYVAKRFYNPIIISCKETGEKDSRPNVNMEPGNPDYVTKAQLCVTNDTLAPVSGTVTWALRKRNSEVLINGSKDITVEALSVLWLDELDFHKTDVSNNYFSFSFVVNGKVISDGTALFTAPKHFEFLNPQLSYEMSGNEITVHAHAYAKYVEIYSPDSDFILSDNYFDMNGGTKVVKIMEGQPKTIVLRSVFDIR